MTILAIDTAANLCAACLWDERNGRSLASKSEDIGRGHAERLLDLIDEVFVQARLTPNDVNKIAVSVGPGSFTGIRVGVSAARGFALALGVPVFGVSTFSAIASDYLNSGKAGQGFAVAINGGRNQILTQIFDVDGVTTGEPFAMNPDDDLPDHLVGALRLIGNGAALIDENRAAPDFAKSTGTVIAYAKIGTTSKLPAKPIYLRAADAKIQHGFALPHAMKKTK